jgi:hypothetical protein
MKDRTKMIGLGAVIVVSLAGVAYNVAIARSALKTESVIAEPQLGRSVRAGDVGCSRFPSKCRGKVVTEESRDGV